MKKLLCGLAILATATMSYGELIFSDDFAYADGSLTNVSSGAWEQFGGSDDPSTPMVSSQTMQLLDSNTDDVNRPLGTTYSSGNLYYSLSLNMGVDTPGTAADGYYVCTLGTASSGYRDRLILTGNGLTSGDYRVGIANSTAGAVFWDTDLTIGQDYTIVVRSDLDSDTTYLWVNPASESSTFITNQIATSTTVSYFKVRQLSGMGDMTVDDVNVGTTFADVVAVPEPATLGFMGVGLLAAFIARRRLRK